MLCLHCHVQMEIKDLFFLYETNYEEDFEDFKCLGCWGIICDIISNVSKNHSAFAFSSKLFLGSKEESPLIIHPPTAGSLTFQNT